MSLQTWYDWNVLIDLLIMFQTVVKHQKKSVHWRIEHGKVRECQWEPVWYRGISSFSLIKNIPACHTWGCLERGGNRKWERRWEESVWAGNVQSNFCLEDWGRRRRTTDDHTAWSMGSSISVKRIRITVVSNIKKAKLWIRSKLMIIKSKTSCLIRH